MQLAQVILVENDDLVRDSLKELLAATGFPVRAARHAREALSLAASTYGPAIVLTDLHLGPGETGLHLAESVRRQHPEKGVILMTGDVGFSEAALPAGCAFLRKPFGVGQLVEAIFRTESAALVVEEPRGTTPGQAFRMALG